VARKRGLATLGRSENGLERKERGPRSFADPRRKGLSRKGDSFTTRVRLVYCVGRRKSSGTEVCEGAHESRRRNALPTKEKGNLEGVQDDAVASCAGGPKRLSKR